MGDYYWLAVLFLAIDLAAVSATLLVGAISKNWGGVFFAAQCGWLFLCLPAVVMAIALHEWQLAAFASIVFVFTSATAAVASKKW